MNQEGKLLEDTGSIDFQAETCMSQILLQQIEDMNNLLKRFDVRVNGGDSGKTGF